MNSVFNIVVKRLLKSQGKIINNQFISDIVSKNTDEAITPAKLHKLTYSLRNKGYLFSIKKNTFICAHPIKQHDEEFITQQYYRELLKKHCQEYIEGGRYIGGLKAMELHLQNYEIPENIDIINIHKNALEVIIFEKTVNYKVYTSNNTSLYTKIKKYLQKIKIGKYNLPLAPIELAILESLHNPSTVHANLINEYIKKLIRKQKKTFNFDIVILMLQNSKHHVGVNRLYQLSKSIDPTFADKLLAIIKKYSFLT